MPERGAALQREVRQVFGGGHVVIFATALLLAAAATPTMRRLAVRLGVLDHPDARKPQARPIPLLGGLAIVAAVTLSVALFPGRQEIVELAGILLAATWISLWGLWDDRRGLNAGAKLAAELIAGGVLIASGVHVELPIAAWLNVLATLFWVVGITNALNLLDNMDGLAGGVGAVASAFFLVMAALNGQYLVAILAAALLGACLGFLLYNFNPATIFMGDSGSLFLGFLLAALGIKLRFPANVPWVTWLVPIIVLGVPVFDTTLVVVSRLRRGRNPFTTPGTDHVSHRLVGMGWTRREAVLLLYLAGCALGVVAILVSVASALEAVAIAAALFAAAGAALVRLERGFGPPAAAPAPPSGEEAP